MGEVPSPRTALKKLKAARAILETNFILNLKKAIDGISVLMIEKYPTLERAREQKSTSAPSLYTPAVHSIDASLDKNS